MTKALKVCVAPLVGETGDYVLSPTLDSSVIVESELHYEDSVALEVIPTYPEVNYVSSRIYVEDATPDMVRKRVIAHGTIDSTADQWTSAYAIVRSARIVIEAEHSPKGSGPAATGPGEAQPAVGADASAFRAPARLKGALGIQKMSFWRISKAVRWLFAGLIVALPNSVPAQDAAPEPHQTPPEQGEIQIPLFRLPRTISVGQYQVTIRNPEDPEESFFGGSGGPIMYLVVAGPGFIEPEVTQFQTIWLYARDKYSQPPAFTLWSKTGVSSSVRCRLEWLEQEYCVTECQDFELGEDGLRSVGSPRVQPSCKQ